MEAVEFVADYAQNFYTNVTNITVGMDSKKWIRLVIVVGAYLLARPLLLKFGAYIQEKEHEKEITTEELEIMAGGRAKISPNSLRGQVNIPEDTESEEEEEQPGTTGADWGKKARKRQRQVLKRILDQEEALRKQQQEDDEDKDIQQFLESDALVDYKEGEDGW